MSALQIMNAEQLVRAFTEIALEQDVALRNAEVQRYKQLFSELSDIEAELKARVGDGRRMLFVLYRHDNAQVRLRAAHATLAIAPDKARAEIQAVYDSGVSPQSLHAGMTLSNLDRGIYKPA